MEYPTIEDQIHSATEFGHHHQHLHDDVLPTVSPPMLSRCQSFHIQLPSEEIMSPPLDSKTLLLNASNRLSPTSHHHRMNQAGNTSPSKIVSPQKQFEIIPSSSASSPSPDLTHRKEILKKGTRIPNSLMASFDKYDNLKRQRANSNGSGKTNHAHIESPLNLSITLSIPSSPVQLVETSPFNTADAAAELLTTDDTCGEYSILISTSTTSSTTTTSFSVPSSPNSESARRPFTHSNSKKRLSAVKVETLTPNSKSRLKPSQSSPNFFFQKSNSTLQKIIADEVQAEKQQQISIYQKKII